MAKKLTKKELKKLMPEPEQKASSAILGLFWATLAMIAITTWLFWLAFKGVQTVWGLF